MNATTEYLSDRIRSTEEDLRRKLVELRQTADRIERGLDEGLRLNDLGEIQRTGPEIDRLLALRQSYYDARGVAEYDAEKGGSK